MLGPGNENEACRRHRGLSGGLQIAAHQRGNAATGSTAGRRTSSSPVGSFARPRGLEPAAEWSKPRQKTAGAGFELPSPRQKIFRRHDRWQKWTEVALSPETLQQLAGSCAEFLIHAVDKEGLCRGIDRDLVKLLAVDAHSDDLRGRRKFHVGSGGK